MDGEKRKRTRVPAHHDVAILIGNSPVRVRINNISLTGLLCATDPVFYPQADCRVVIRLGEALSISIEAKIQRIDGQETAIHFLAMDEENFFHLKRLVQFNAEDADEIEQELRKGI